MYWVRGIRLSQCVGYPHVKIISSSIVRVDWFRGGVVSICYPTPLEDQIEYNGVVKTFPFSRS